MTDEEITAYIEQLAERAKQRIEVKTKTNVGLFTAPQDFQIAYEGNVRKFVQRVIEWHASPDWNDHHAYDGSAPWPDSLMKYHKREVLLYPMFRHCLEFDAENFIDSLFDFVHTCILDDGSFVIRWKRSYADIAQEWECSRDDPDARPVVYANYSGDTCQSVEDLLEAMDVMQEREEAALAERVARELEYRKLNEERKQRVGANLQRIRKRLWQPISTAPMTPEGEWVLICEPGIGATIAQRRSGYAVDHKNEERWHADAWIDHGGDLRNPTHWMPMPEPPKEDDNEVATD